MEGMEAMLQNMMSMGGPPPNARGSGGGGGGGSMPTGLGGGGGGMPDFAALFDSLGPDGTPDFDKFARASGMDAGEMKGHAARLWKHMDHLAKSPDEYQQFIRKQAENAGVDPTAFSAAGVGAGSGGKGGVGAAAAGTARGGGGRAPISDNRATFLMPMGQGGGTTEVGVVAVWRANDASTPTATAPDLLALFPLPNSPHAWQVPPPRGTPRGNGGAARPPPT